MTIVFKNFFRNDFVNLSAKSVRYFLPEVKIYCLSLFKNDISEYDSYAKINVDQEFFKKTKYSNLGNGNNNSKNGLFFAEGFNYIFDIFQNIDDKILILAEDHFFTNGSTLKELINTDFDIAYANWHFYAPIQASIFCFNPQKTKHFFPIDERPDWVEYVFEDAFLKKKTTEKFHLISTRDGANYMGDGKYTNDLEEIHNALRNVNIL